MNLPEESQLGKTSSYVDQYNPNLLFPIARAPKRVEIGLNCPTVNFTNAKKMPVLPFFGADLWTAFELSWLNLKGKPQVALLHLVVPCETPHMIESKSFKLYLNSFNNSRFVDSNDVLNRLKNDLSRIVWCGVEASLSLGVKLVLPDEFQQESVQELEGLDLDRLDIECNRYTPAPDLLCVNKNAAPITQTLTSRLLKSNCLVTGQPDWGNISIRYHGHEIDQEGLLQYLVSFRQHNEFHEQCVERIFMDIWRRCEPTQLTVYARYTRRGGLDISPFRTSHPQALPRNARTARQ